MNKLIFALIALAACKEPEHQNIAITFATMSNSDAKCTPIASIAGNDTAFCMLEHVVFFCKASELEKPTCEAVGGRPATTPPAPTPTAEAPAKAK